VSGKNDYSDWDDDDSVGGMIRLKKVKPKDIRGMYTEGLSPKDARKENRDLRKQLARRQRRNEKQNFNLFDDNSSHERE
jgi:hypothetical protein